MANIKIQTPHEVVERHAFNTEDGKTKFASKLASSYDGNLIKVAYNYELKLWHNNTLGRDTLTTMQVPVTVICESGSPNLVL